ncbi:MAG: type IX secretion system PorP/SprF family membrane protein [Marivirga sp.]|jgi:type IX secretion system PorP/SprF family membrane protein
MLRKVSTIFICIIGVCANLLAQQRPQYTQYFNNQFLINPAIAGSQNMEEIKIGGRIQWIGFENAPQTYFATYTTPFKKAPFKTTMNFKGHHGLGATVIKDITGPVSQTSFHLSYAYHHPLTNNIYASVGASLGALQHTIDMEQLQFKNMNDPIIDRLILNRVIPDGSIGIWIYSNRFYFGASATQLIGNSALFLPVGERQVEIFDLNAHFFVNTGYKIDVGDPRENWFVVPSILFKAVRPAAGHFDFNIMVQKGNDYWTGLSFRQNDSASALIGFSVKKDFSFTYSYDYIISDIGPYSGGSHEIVLSFKYKRKQKKVICPESFWH